MGDSFQLLDIILFALIAAFLALRLRNVLGRRDGHQGPTRRPAPAPQRAEETNDNLVSLPSPLDEQHDKPAAAEPENAATLSPLDAGLTQIRISDPRFNVDEFLSGARIAFELVVTAYAAGDIESLRPLLSQEVLGNFAQLIKDREDAGERMETEVRAIRSAEIAEAYMAGRTAHLTVKFVSDQVTIVRDKNNAVIEGTPGQPTEVIDFWTFARDTRSSDPNWTLIATGNAE